MSKKAHFFGDIIFKNSHFFGDNDFLKQKNPAFAGFLEAPPGIGPGIKVLQTSALPLGYGA